MERAPIRLSVPLEIPADALTVVAPLPELVSQATALTVLGIPPRPFLDALRSVGFPVPVLRLGKLRLVNRAEFVAWLAKQSAANDGSYLLEDPRGKGA